MGWVEEIIEHAEEGAPQEVCGVVLREDNDYRVVRMMNVHPNPENFYAFHGEEQDRLFQRMSETKYDLYAFYHSHPTTDATLSGTDMVAAYYEGIVAYPGVRYIIVSLSLPSPYLRAYIFEREGPHEVSLQDETV